MAMEAAHVLAADVEMQKEVGPTPSTPTSQDAKGAVEQESSSPAGSGSTELCVEADVVEASQGEVEGYLSPDLPSPSSAEGEPASQHGAAPAEAEAAAAADEAVEEQPRAEELKEPTRPQSSFFVFLESARAHISEELSAAGITGGGRVSKRAGELWQEMSAEEREPFEARALELKVAYEDQMEVFLAKGGMRKKRKGAPEEVPDLNANGEAQPLKPKTAFFCYMDAQRGAIAEELGQTKGNLVSKRAGEKWKDMSADDKAVFESQAALLRTAYAQKVKAFLSGGGVLRKRRKLAAAEEEEPASPDQLRRGGSGDALSTTPPKAPKPERFRMQLGALVVGINYLDGSLQEGEKLRIKRDRRSSANPNALAVYDGSLGCHVGYLADAAAAVLGPLIDGNPKFRMSGKVAPKVATKGAGESQSQSQGDSSPSDTSSPSIAKGSSSEDVKTDEMQVELVLAGPMDLQEQLETLVKSCDAFTVAVDAGETVDAADAEAVVPEAGAADADAAGDAAAVRVDATDVEVEAAVDVVVDVKDVNMEVEAAVDVVVDEKDVNMEA